jgi:demethylmenaquinone methyltransferase/2-methoxy-6-polyprenyl-1,4-benzoquinol methylase
MAPDNRRRPQSDPQLTAYYAARAAEYENIYDKPERQADLQRLRALIPAHFAGRKVLEIACGTGYWTQHIAPAAASVTALDINEETLAIARDKPLPPGRVRFDVADVHAVYPAYQGYSGAFAGFWWSHLRRSERGAFLETLHRALAPGAVVMLLDNRYVEGSSTPISHADAEGNTYQQRTMADGTRHVVLKNFPAQAELLADVAGRGANAEYIALDYFWALKYVYAG